MRTRIALTILFALLVGLASAQVPYHNSVAWRAQQGLSGPQLPRQGDIVYRWVASDATTEVVAGFADQKAGLLLTNNNANRLPIKQGKGIWLCPNLSLTNMLPSMTSYTLMYSMWPVSLGVNGGSVDQRFIGNVVLPTFYLTWYSNHIAIYDNSAFDHVSSPLLSDTNFSLCYVITNNTSGKNCLFYTNGVYSATHVLQTSIMPWQLGLGLRHWFFELDIWTNALSAAEVAQAANYSYLTYPKPVWGGEYYPLTNSSLITWYRSDKVKLGVASNMDTAPNDGSAAGAFSDLISGFQFTSPASGAIYHSSGGGANNRPYLGFTNQYYSSGSGLPFRSQPIWYFATINTAGVVAGTFLLDSDNPGNLLELCVAHDTLGTYLYAGTTLATDTSWPFSGKDMIISACFNGASSVIRSNGVQWVSGVNPGSNPLGTIYLGGYAPSLASYRYNGKIYEIRIYNGNLSAGQVSDIESDMRTWVGF